MAAENGWDILFNARESHSGRTGARTKFEDAKEFIRMHPGKVRFYLIRGIDRFTRAGSYSYASMKLELAALNVELVDSYGVIQPSRNSLEHLGVEYDWSRYYPSEAAEIAAADDGKSEVIEMLNRTIGKQIVLTRDGYYHTGVPNDGYINKKIFVDGKKKKTIQIADPERAKFYIQMFELRASGLYTDIQIVDQLNAQGFLTKIQNRWDGDKERIVGTRGGVPLSVKQLQRYISNPIYAGVMCEEWTFNLPVKAKYKGLVDIDVFNKANQGKVFIKKNPDDTLEMLYNYDPNRIKKKMKENPLFPFKFVLCPLCDKQKPFVGSSPKGKSGKTFATYHCPRKHKYLGVPKDEFEKNVKNFLSRLQFSPEFMDSLEASVINKYREKERAIASDAADMGTNISSLRTQKIMELDSLALTKNPSIRTDIEDRIEEINRKIDLAQQQRNKLEVNEADIDNFIKQARKLMEHPGEIIINQAEYQARESLYNLFFEVLPTYFDILNGTPKLTWIFELTSTNQSSENQLAAPTGFEPVLHE